VSSLHHELPGLASSSSAAIAGPYARSQPEGRTVHSRARRARARGDACLLQPCRGSFRVFRGYRTREPSCGSARVVYLPGLDVPRLNLLFGAGALRRFLRCAVVRCYLSLQSWLYFLKPTLGSRGRAVNRPRSRTTQPRSSAPGSRLGTVTAARGDRGGGAGCQA
jgi:hypothetical protein